MSVDPPRKKRVIYLKVPKRVDSKVLIIRKQLTNEMMYVNHTYCGNHFAIYGASHVVLVVKNLPANAEDVEKHELDPWVGEIWRKHGNPLMSQ